MHTKTLRDLALLGLLAALIYLPGLTTHGVTNWQEGQRLIVAREMQLRGDWLLPTVNNQPYLAKPPLIYWCQLAIAEIRGGQVSLFDLRLTVALAGVLGVLATYWAGRQILDPSTTPAVAQASGGRLCDSSVQQIHFARDASFWGAAMLATGLLSARSARIGELDILLIPSVSLAVGAIARAWRAHRERQITDVFAVGLAVVASCLAALAKGPPGLLVIALAAYGGIALHAANTNGPLDLKLFGNARAKGKPVAPVPRLQPATGLTTRLRIVAALIAAVLVCIAIVAGGGNDRLGSVPGWLLHIIMAACVGAAFAGLFSPRRAWACFVAYSRTHPVAVLVVPVLAVLGWWSAATTLLSPEQRSMLLSQEAEDNLRLFVLESPLRNLEAASYGVGLGSIAAIATLVWMIQRRPKLDVGWYVLVTWALLPIVAMSWLGKGVPRYLTPAWPGIALLGGLGVAQLLHNRAPAATRLRTALGACVIALGAALSLWYGYGREVSNSWRSPRNFVAELTRETGRVAPSDTLLICSYEFQTPALDYYVGGALGRGRSVIPVDDVRVNNSMMGGRAWTLEDLHAALLGVSDGAVVLVREHQPSDRPTPHSRPPIDALQSAGFVVEEIPISAEFRIDGGRTRVKAVVVRLP